MVESSPWLELYNSPDPGKIFALNAQEFRDFVAYVFTRAGYHTQPFHTAGADFALTNENQIVGYVATSAGVHNVGLGPVLQLNGLPAANNLPKFYVSSEGFASKVPDANEAPDLLLLDISRLQRFISYVHGTRHPQSKNTPFSPMKLFRGESKKRDKARTKVIALANNKGGVCKTTSSLIIGLILALEKGKKVLFVDMDDQANLTQVVFGKARYDLPNISDYFADFNSYPLESLITPTRFKNAWVIPSHPDLRLTLSNNVDWTETEKRFTASLHYDAIAVPEGGDFDWIILDTPPSLSLYTRAAMIAAHYVLTPFAPSSLDEIGLRNLIETLTDVSCIASGANQTQMLGCFTTRWKRTAATEADVKRMRLIAIQKGAQLFETDIDEDPTNIRKLILPENSPNPTKIHGALDDYRELVKEIQNHVGDD